MTTTIPSMRLFASIAKCLTISISSLPPKLTPIIRSLMTNLKNESSNSDRVEQTSKSIASLVYLLSLKRGDQEENSSQRKATRDKILENICKLAFHKNAASTKSAKRVIQIMFTDYLPRMVGDATDSAVTLEEAFFPLWKRLIPLTSRDPASGHPDDLELALRTLSLISTTLENTNATSSLSSCIPILNRIIQTISPTVTLISISSPHLLARTLATDSTLSLSRSNPTDTLHIVIPILCRALNCLESPSRRLAGCHLFRSLVLKLGVQQICPFVTALLPAAMSAMSDSVAECARVAAEIFAVLVRVAPLVRGDVADGSGDVGSSKKVMDHLIHGKPLPPTTLPPRLAGALEKKGVVLRDYQKEGISWINFLQSVKLNGVLADEMGLGKTLQALIGMGIAHCAASPSSSSSSFKSLVVCPSTLVGHWCNEVHKFMGDFFQVLDYSGSAKKRKKVWQEYDWRRGDTEEERQGTIVVTSYAILRNDWKTLSDITWMYCILDEGHLLKNPKTATAIAARKMRSRHRLILTGTPVQNRVHELWATFDFLLPNFLGSAKTFTREYAKPILQGQQLSEGTTPDQIHRGMEKLKELHQQVLPFILRREKRQVLKELPPKIITDIPCHLSAEQGRAYATFCEGKGARLALDCLQTTLDAGKDGTGEIAGAAAAGAGQEVLKSLLYLRLICTHPSLVDNKKSRSSSTRRKEFNYLDSHDPYASLECSGKLTALNDLLRNAGIYHEGIMAADNDSSAIYIDEEVSSGHHDKQQTANAADDDVDEESMFLHRANMERQGVLSNNDTPAAQSKCLIFAQFMNSLDVLERYLLQPHMPSLRYLRLDGRVPLEDRTAIVNQFNEDESVKVMLLTTKIGGLGLNLTGADVVIFLEHDWNPHVDLQAMDRAHRIGQKKTVNVYRLVTRDTIEEKVMRLQKVKLAMSDAIINSENSTLFSMGTDRLLDLFTFGEEKKGTKSSLTGGENGDGCELDVLDELWSEEEYSNLSVQSFLGGIVQD